MKNPCLKMEELEWLPDGTESNPKSRLWASFNISGYCMHLEAIEVEEKNGVQDVVNAALEDNLDHYYAAAEPAGRFDPVEIDGRNYVLFAYPHT